LLKERLQAARAPDAKQVQAWIAQLDSDRFQEREQAEQQLLHLGEAAQPALRAALQKPASLEQQRRLERLVERPQAPPSALQCLRELRALEVLERLGGAEARKLVERVAGGDAAAVQTHEARMILGRWHEATAGP
jgi:hypothetical protein